MTQFDDRKKAFEDQFAHSQELQFKVTARRNKLLGLWAADRLGLSGEARDEYAKSVVMSDFDEPGDDDVLRKVMGDLDAASAGVGRDMLRAEMTRLLEVAKQQIMAES